MPPRDFKYKFVLERYTPSTGLGHFDAIFDPSTGRMAVIVKFAIKYNDQYFNSAFPDGGVDPGTHKHTVGQKFVARAALAVPEQWNNKFQFRCTKKGFKNVVAKPEFVVVNEPEKRSAHYLIKLKDDPGPDLRAVVSEDRSRNWGYHKAMMTTRDVSRHDAGTKLELFLQDLVKGYCVPVRLPPGGDPRSFNIRQAHRLTPAQAPPSPDRELAEQRLRDFLRQGRSLEQIVGRGTIRWVLTVTGSNQPQINDLKVWAQQLFEPGEQNRRRLEVREVKAEGP